jgi:hypothetical protein
MRRARRGLQHDIDLYDAQRALPADAVALAAPTDPGVPPIALSGK